MSADDGVPDERGTPGEAAAWALILFVGLAAFLYDFLRVVVREVPAAQPIEFVHDFQQTMFLIAIVGGGLTVGLIVYAVFSFAAGRRTAPFPPNVARGRLLMSVFAIGLAFLMVTTMFIGASTLAQTDAATDGATGDRLDVERSIDVSVSASQWFWRFDVEGMPNAQGERVVVPADTVVNLRITSADVIHSFAIQELGLKKDAFPGQVNRAWFYVESVDGETTVEAGDERIPADAYTVTCAELCGKAHSKMTATVYVVEPNEYEHWAEANGGTVPASFREQADDGGDHDDEH